MGLWSKLTAKKTKGSGEQNESSPPKTPARGKITQFDGADGVGDITLEDGTALRFGRSACKGFDPILSAQVEVTEVGPHRLGGHRAKRVVPLEGTQAELDRLHDERAEQHGLPEPAQGEAVASACGLGTVTILLRDAPQHGRAAIRNLFESADVLTEGVGLDFGPSPTLNLGGRALQVFVGHEPFPRDELDCRVCGDDFDLGSGFVSLSTGLADLDLNTRYMLGNNTPDAWGPDGALRLLSKVALKLLALGTGVVVHRAGGVLYPAQHWTRLLGDLDDPDFRPFGAWTDIGFSEDRKQLQISGMSVSSHPSLAVEVEDFESDDEYIRARGALLLACSQMVHENRLLTKGERIEVPWGVEVGALPVSPADCSGDLTASVYEVIDDGFVLRPVRVGKSPSQEWERTTSSDCPDTLSFAAYKELFLGTLMRVGGLAEIATMGFDDIPPEMPQHEIVVLQRDDGKFAVATCGLGRVVQPNGSVEDDTAHLEFMIVLPDHHPRIAIALSFVGRYLHGRDKDAAPWGPEHRIMVEGPFGPETTYALGFVGNIEFDSGPPISMLCPTIMSATERESVSIDDVPAWLAEHGNGDNVRDRWLEFVNAD